MARDGLCVKDKSHNEKGPETFIPMPKWHIKGPIGPWPPENPKLDKQDTNPGSCG